MDVLIHRHSSQVLDVVVKKGRVLTGVTAPEWNLRIEISISEFRKSFNFSCVGTVEEPAKSE